MDIPSDRAENILSTLKKAHHVLIISHRNPDADTIGSNIALRYALESKGIKVTSACVDTPGPDAMFIPEAHTFIKEINPLEYDTFITVDAGSTAQAAFPVQFPQMLDGQKPFIVIDHHPSNNAYGTINLVIDDAASTTLVLFHLFKKWEEPITPKIATCLLYGLYYDTGSFMHSNTCNEVYQTASELMSLGADHKTIIKYLFKTRPIEQLKIWGEVLEGLKITENQVVVSAVNSKTMNDLGATNHHLSGVIDYLSMIKENRFATLLCEDGQGHIRGSFRTRRDDVDVGSMAQSLGGGGHKKASGFTINGELREEIHWSVDEWISTHEEKAKNKE